MFPSVNASEENANALDKLRTAFSALETEFREIAKDLASCTLTDREQIHKKLFHNDKFYQLGDVLRQFAIKVKNEAESNPAMAEFRDYVTNLVKDVQAEYDALDKTYRKAVGENMYGEATKMLGDAVVSGRLCTRNNKLSIPEGVTANLKARITDRPFETMTNLKALCAYVAKYGDEGLRFTEGHKDELRTLFAKVIPDGQKAKEALDRLVDRFETVFFSEFLIRPEDAAQKFSRPDLVVNYFKENPEALTACDPGFNLDGDNAVADIKSAIKDRMLADIKKPLQEKKDDSLTSLSSGIMPQTIREYVPGRVTFNGKNIPCAKLGTKFTFKNADNPERKGFAEFLETKFDANHKKMRQLVSFSCGMALGLGGAIDSLLDNGGEKIRLKGAPRQTLCDKGASLVSANGRQEENYDIKINDNGDVTISLTHVVRNMMTSLTSKSSYYMLRDISGDASPIVGSVKFTATMTIKNASDAELGNGMPEFTIDDFKQEEI